MKPRRVVITIEIETDLTLAEIKAGIKDDLYPYGSVVQVQTNVIKDDKLVNKFASKI